MQKNKSFAVIGGDSRQLYAAQYLYEHGYSINVYGLEHAQNIKTFNYLDSLDEASDSEYILLPLPVMRASGNLNAPFSDRTIKIKEITDIISSRNTVFYGMGPASFVKQAEAEAKHSCDYFNIERLNYKNALLTAEGILSIVLDSLPLTVNGLNIAVTGYGRIGYFISKILNVLGAEVNVFARSSLQRVKCETEGIKSMKLSELNKHIKKYKCVINTVPFPVVDKEAILYSDEKCVFIETASAPYGIDASACHEYGRNLIKAFSLPGKTAPETAGFIIGETLISYIEEED